jgi:ATP/maltotriose-dependent transcriptional regulator MalT
MSPADGLLTESQRAGRRRDKRATEGSNDDVAAVEASNTIGPLLALLVDVYLEQGCLDEAEQTVQRLHHIANAQRGTYLPAAAALAQGRVCVATGRGDARACLNSALHGFAKAQLPMELARYNKDFITARGIHDAFRDAELCVDALHEAFSGARSFDAAMADYQTRRDDQVLARYEFTTELATLEPPPPPELQQLLAAMTGNQDAMDGLRPGQCRRDLTC